MKRKALMLTPLLLVGLLASCQNQDGESLPPDEPLPSADLTYYEVTFDSMGGSQVPSQQVLAGNPVRRPDAPTREDYTFSGWYQDSEYTDLWDFDTDRVEADMTLYARWDEVSEEPKPTSSLVYELDEATNTYTVIDVGEETNVVIPSTYEGLPVTRIQGQYGTGAFARKDIVSITIPDSIIEIGNNSFNNCSDLVEVNISEGSNLETIGRNAFSGCSVLPSLYIPSHVSSIGDSAFNNCGAMNEFTVAEGNETYRSENGHLIQNDENILIRGANNEIVPEGVIILSEASFRRATISSLTIPASVTTIGNYFIADSNIETINYQGTEEEWDAITKDSMWDFRKEDIVINFDN